MWKADEMPVILIAMMVSPSQGLDVASTLRDRDQ